MSQRKQFWKVGVFNTQQKPHYVLQFFQNPFATKDLQIKAPAKHTSLCKKAEEEDASAIAKAALANC